MFEEVYDQFIQRHLAGRTGERRGRLERGHRHAESLFLKNVWWPLRGNLEHLHPEYECWIGGEDLISRIWHGCRGMSS